MKIVMFVAQKQKNETNLSIWLTSCQARLLLDDLDGKRLDLETVLSKYLFFPQIGIGINLRSQLLYKYE